MVVGEAQVLVVEGEVFLASGPIIVRFFYLLLDGVIVGGEGTLIISRLELGQSQVVVEAWFRTCVLHC